MAKESMKAREVKRAKMCARYAAKRKALKDAGDYFGLQNFPRIHLLLDLTTDVKLLVVQRVI